MKRENKKWSSKVLKKNLLQQIKGGCDDRKIPDYDDGQMQQDGMLVVIHYPLPN